MPWVGGELCRGAFLHGMENYGLHLLRQYRDHLRNSDNGVHVWYWPNGEPGFRTTNEVPHTGWGMSEWVAALFHGLAGIRDESGLMRRVTLSPRWAATGETSVRVVQRYAVGTSYIAYDYQCDNEGAIRITVAGSGKEATIRLLLPDGWSAKQVTLGGADVEFAEETVEASRYVVFAMKIHNIGCAKVLCS